MVQINTQKFGCSSGFSTCLEARDVTRTDSLITAAVLPVLATDEISRKIIFLVELGGVGGSKGKWDGVFRNLSNLIPKLGEDAETRKDSTFLLYLGFGCTLK